VEVYLHTPIRLNGVVIKHRDKSCLLWQHALSTEFKIAKEDLKICVLQIGVQLYDPFAVRAPPSESRSIGHWLRWDSHPHNGDRERTRRRNSTDLDFN